MDIHCTWDPRLDPEIPSNYSLYWETANSEYKQPQTFIALLFSELYSFDDNNGKTWRELSLFYLASLTFLIFRIDHVISTTQWNGSIHRKHFQRNEELHVWVEAQNQHGSARSQKVTFNTEDISKSTSNG